MHHGTLPILGMEWHGSPDAELAELGGPPKGAGTRGRKQGPATGAPEVLNTAPSVHPWYGSPVAGQVEDLNQGKCREE